ncbi:MAG: aminotransferase class V-fold PLP-dependent enzyme [Candidatus Omnitrophota bacterium]|nr:aminotransferase class V-fold PLP-dependent enzyme [Candidatus Omnitrophota bacterium]
MKSIQTKKTRKINLLPGPIYIHDRVKSDFGRVPISHRDDSFSGSLKKVKGLLHSLTRCKKVEVCLGTGTLANDIIASQLSLLNKRGLILSNGEFGERLIRHAQGFGLKYQNIKMRWGTAFDYQRINLTINRNNIQWIWFVHHETSTGMLNDFNRLLGLSRKFKLLFCVDCISSIGAYPIKLAEVDFASGTSGKAIGAYPGLSFVFYKKAYLSKARNVPAYLDLRMYRKKFGIPFTSSSNLLSALKNALQLLLRDRKKFRRIQKQNQWIRKQVIKTNVQILVENERESPLMTTFRIPSKVGSHIIGKNLRDRGFLVHYQGEYLRNRNWVQIVSFSLYSRQHLKPMFDYLKKRLKI